MNLPRLLQRKRLTVLGLNAGTSADGLDQAAIVIDRSRRGYRTRFLAGRTRKYPAELRRAWDDPANNLFNRVYLA